MIPVVLGTFGKLLCENYAELPKTNYSRQLNFIGLGIPRVVISITLLK